MTYLLTKRKSEKIHYPEHDGLFCILRLLRAHAGYCDFPSLLAEFCPPASGHSFSDLLAVCRRVGFVAVAQQGNQNILPDGPAILHHESGRFLAKISFGAPNLIYDPCTGETHAVLSQNYGGLSGYYISIKSCFPVRERISIKPYKLYLLPQHNLIKDQCNEVSAELSSLVTLYETRTYQIHPDNMTVERICEIHRSSYIRDHAWGGKIREKPLRRGTAEFVDHGLVSLYLKAWCVLYNDSKISYDQTNSRDYFARLLSDLNGIHPFTDGNGRLVDAVASLGWPTSQSTYAICPVNRSQRYVASWAAGLGDIRLFARLLTSAPFEASALMLQPSPIEELCSTFCRVLRIRNFLTDDEMQVVMAAVRSDLPSFRAAGLLGLRLGSNTNDIRVANVSSLSSDLFEVLESKFRVVLERAAQLLRIPCAQDDVLEPDSKSGLSDFSQHSADMSDNEPCL